MLEVISYNEQAGRFEFQVVTDYRAGATPRVAYARRAVCGACHHAAAPISPARLGRDQCQPGGGTRTVEPCAKLSGVAVKRGVDVPNAIDDSVLRANRMALAQTIWRRGCDAVQAPSDPVACREALLVAVLQRRLGAEQSRDRTAAARSRAALHWPHPGRPFGRKALPNPIRTFPIGTPSSARRNSSSLPGRPRRGAPRKWCRRSTPWRPARRWTHGDRMRAAWICCCIHWARSSPRPMRARSNARSRPACGTGDASAIGHARPRGVARAKPAPSAPALLTDPDRAGKAQHLLARAVARPCRRDARRHPRCARLRGLPARHAAARARPASGHEDRARLLRPGGAGTDAGHARRQRACRTGRDPRVAAPVLCALRCVPRYADRVAAGVPARQHRGRRAQHRALRATHPIPSGDVAAACRQPLEDAHAAAGVRAVVGARGAAADIERMVDYATRAMPALAAERTQAQGYESLPRCRRSDMETHGARVQ